MKTILFLDNWMIEKQICLERVWGRPRFVKEVFRDFHPNVLGYGGYASLFWDEHVGKYVMYAAVYPPEADPGTFVLRLESDDPYEWDDPIYDVAATPAWKAFEKVAVDENNERFWAIYINSLAGTPFADRGYLMSTYHPNREANQSIAGTSQDGLHFDLSQTRAWQPTRADTWCGWIWNEQRSFFQIHTRPVHVDRRISVVTSSDLQEFAPAVTVLQPDAFDPPGTEFYSMPADPYEDMFIGQLHVFSTDSFEENQRVKMAGRMQTHLTYSYNGLNWYRTTREPFIPTRDYGVLGGGQVYGMEMLRTREDRLLFLVHGSWGEHASYPDMQAAGFDTRGAFGPLLYDMRLDGFCSLKTSGKDGLLHLVAEFWPDTQPNGASTSSLVYMKIDPKTGMIIGQTQLATSGYVYQPHLIAQGAILHLAWIEATAAGKRARYTQTSLPDTTKRTSAPFTNTIIKTLGQLDVDQHQWAVQLSVDGQTLVAAWMQRDVEGWSVAMTTSADAGLSWKPDLALTSAAMDHVDHLSIISDKAKSFRVAWSGHIPGQTNTHIDAVAVTIDRVGVPQVTNSARLQQDSPRWVTQPVWGAGGTSLIYTVIDQEKTRFERVRFDAQQGLSPMPLSLNNEARDGKLHISAPLVDGQDTYLLYTKRNPQTLETTVTLQLAR